MSFVMTGQEDRIFTAFIFFSTIFFELFLRQLSPLYYLFCKVITNQVIDNFLYMYNVFFNKRIR